MKKLLKSLKTYKEEVGDFKIAVDHFIRRKPVFEVFKIGVEPQSKAILGSAIKIAHEAIQVINSTLFYPRILQAFQLFVKCDSYIIFSEIL